MKLAQAAKSLFLKEFIDAVFHVDAVFLCPQGDAELSV